MLTVVIIIHMNTHEWATFWSNNHTSFCVKIFFQRHVIMDCVSHLFCSQRIPPSHRYIGYGPLLSFTQHGATSGHTPLAALVISVSSSPQQKKLIIARGSPLSQFTDCVLSAIIRCIVLLHHQSIERTSSSLSLHGQSQ